MFSLATWPVYIATCIFVVGNDKSNFECHSCLLCLLDRPGGKRRFEGDISKHGLEKKLCGFGGERHGCGYKYVDVPLKNAAVKYSAIFCQEIFAEKYSAEKYCAEK